MLTLIESIVRATIRQSDSEAIASEAATASVSRVEATGATLPLKPAAPADRIMAWILQGAGESAPLLELSRNDRRQYCGGGDTGKRQNRGGKPDNTRYPSYYTRYPRNPRFQHPLCGFFDRAGGQYKVRSASFRRGQRSVPDHRLPRPPASPWAQSPGFARRASARRAPREMSIGRSRIGRRHGCSRRARYRRP